MSRNNEKNETKNDTIQIPELDEEDKQTSEERKIWNGPVEWLSTTTTEGFIARTPWE